MNKIFLGLLLICIICFCSACINTEIIQSWQKEHDTISKEYYENVLCKPNARLNWHGLCKKK